MPCEGRSPGRVVRPRRPPLRKCLWTPTEALPIQKRPPATAPGGVTPPISPTTLPCCPDRKSARCYPRLEIVGVTPARTPTVPHAYGLRESAAPARFGCPG